MKSIKWKLTIMYLGLVLIVMIASGTFILLSLQNIEVDKNRNQLELYAEKIEEQVVLNHEEKDFQEELRNFIQIDSRESTLQGNILDAQGITLASTTTERGGVLPQFKTSVVLSALSGQASYGSGRQNADSYGLMKEYMSYAKPVIIGGQTKYVVYTLMDTSAMESSLNQTRQTIVISVFLALALTIIMGYIFARTLTGPISVLTQKAKELAEGNLNQKIKVRSVDEIGQLTESFNYMSAELGKTVSEISREKNKLEIILHNMTDGVLSFDKTGELTHVNMAAMEMLETEEMTLSLSQFINRFDISTGVYLDANTDVSKQATFPVGKKFIQASFSPYSNERKEVEGLVVVLQDITEQKKLDDMRKEFVANVSHELRTPLTTVKSYTETLMDGAMEDKEIAMEFLGIIDSEADRMAFLVRDLLQLSRFDNHQVQFSFSQMNLKDFLEEILKQNKIHAENKEQTLMLEPCKEDIYIVADRDRASQVLNNIVTNAIKYSLQKAEIKIYVTEDNQYYKIHVRDTGMGIQKEDLPRIFERFYRVDKARSRAMGGTGLGLAIAKEIMEGHQGQITVESEYGKGTTMTMWFPKTMEI